MTLTHEYYDELLEYDKKNISKNIISKQYTGPKGTQLVYAISYYSRLRQLYFKSGNIVLEEIPQCNGIGVKKVKLREYSQLDYYIELSQNKESDADVFEVIVEDIRKSTDKQSDREVVQTASKVLRKWKSFFAQQKQLLMSEERRQGLYGELLYLRDLIDEYGAVAVSFWSGCKFETHDFYINKNAVEIKTTSTKAPYKMHISSEYQLETDDVCNKLYLVFYALRKSAVDGGKLPDLINEIKMKLGHNTMMQERLVECLEEYGYFEGLEEHYNTGYFVREEFHYNVDDDFPRISKEMLMNGVSNCKYDVLSDMCKPYLLEKKELMRQIKEKQ